MLKPGTRIELHGTPAIGGFPGVAPEKAVICRWTAKNGPKDGRISPATGWNVVQFQDGGRLCVHKNNFRVIDNR